MNDKYRAKLEQAIAGIDRSARGQDERERRRVKMVQEQRDRGFDRNGRPLDRKG